MKKQTIARTYVDTTYQVGQLKKLLIGGWIVVQSNVINQGGIAVEYILEKKVKNKENK